MQTIIQVLLVSTLIAGHFSQNIVIDNSTLISPCTTGVRSTVDTYFITGTIGDNITTALYQKWLTVINIKVLRRTSQRYETICELYMGIGTCRPYSAIKCECLYNTTTDQARFTISGPVQADDSNAVVNVQWEHINKTIIYSNNYSFPEVYEAHLDLTVDGVTENLPSGSCSFSLTLNKSNDLELCCSNTAIPCSPQISFGGTVVNNSTETCVTYSASQLASDGVTGNLVLSYSVCNLTDYRQGSICTAKPKPDETTTESTSSSTNTTGTYVTTTTTESSSSSANATDASTTTTESSSSSSHPTDASTATTESSSSSSHPTAPVPPPPPPPPCGTTCIAIIVTVVVVICVVGIGVAVYCYKKKKTSKAVSNHGTNGNRDKPHTSEDHKKDGQHSEHTNKAYDGNDGRRSSPSEVTVHGVKSTTDENVQQHNTVHEKDNKQISGRTNDGNASQTETPRRLPPLKGTHNHDQLHPTTVESRPISIEITSTNS